MEEFKVIICEKEIIIKRDIDGFFILRLRDIFTLEGVNAKSNFFNPFCFS